MSEIPAEYLPPREHLPEKIYPLPEVRLPRKLNLTEIARDRNILEGRRPRVAILYRDRKITCLETHRLSGFPYPGDLYGMGLSGRCFPTWP